MVVLMLYGLRMNTRGLNDELSNRLRAVVIKIMILVFLALCS
jgi:hypothetical protein